MAVCQIWKVKGRLDHSIDYATNPDKTQRQRADQDQALCDIIRYTANSKKTAINDQECFVSGIGCNVATARSEMNQIKTMFRDDKEIIAFHGFQSFAPDEVTPEIAHQIGMELAKQLWGERFQVVVATHLNTNCLHNHFVINATSFVDGKRYYDNKESFRRFRATSDTLCKAHCLSVIEHPDPYKSHKYLVKMDKAGMPTRHNLAREAIDQAVAQAHSNEEFFSRLKELGYKFDFRATRKYATITPIAYGKAIRVHQLGEEYTKERIFARIAQRQKVYQPPPFQKHIYPVDRARIDKAKAKGGLYGLYLHYCYRLGILPKGSRTNNLRVHYLFRDDLKQIDNISAQVNFLHTHQFRTVEEVVCFVEDQKAQMEMVKKRRVACWNSLRTKTDQAQIEGIKKEIAGCSTILATMRKEVRLCEDIVQKAATIRKNLQVVEQQERKPEREVSPYDKFR